MVVFMRTLNVLALCTGLVAIPLSGTAQTYTTEELLSLFTAQRDAFDEVKTTGGLKTRGLTMVTVDDLTTEPTIAAATETPTLANPSVDNGSTTITATTDTNPSTSPTEALVTPVMFGKLAPELQVNVRVEFEFDSAVLSATQKPKLEQLCSAMKPSDITLFRIAGHTDTSGTETYNENLSLLRAEEVKRYFVDECGMDAARLEAIGLGERFLHNTGDPKAAENRRVEFQALS